MTNAEMEANKIIVEGDVSVLIEAAKRIGAELARRQLTTNQIRNFFGEVRRIEMNWRTDSAQAASSAYRKVVLLQPKLAYQVRRERNRGLEQLQEVLDPCIDVIRKAPPPQRKPYFDHFVDFFEAILAYHKFAGGN